jgi:hypothetical protein
VAVSGWGGMRKVTSARMIDSKARESAASVASTYFFSSSRSAALPSTLVGHGGLCDGRRSRSLNPCALQCAVYGRDADVEQVARILGGPVQHVAHRIKAIRCRGVGSWITVRKATSMVSRISVSASGVLSGWVGGSSTESGIGPSQTTSSGWPAQPASASALAPRTALRSSRAIASRQAFVATR